MVESEGSRYRRNRWHLIPAQNIHSPVNEYSSRLDSFENYNDVRQSDNMENFCSDDNTNEREIVLEERAIDEVEGRSACPSQNSLQDGQDVEEDSNDQEDV